MCAHNYFVTLWNSNTALALVVQMVCGTLSLATVRFMVSVGRVASVRVKQPLRHGNCLATPLMLQYPPTAQRGAIAGIFGSSAAMTHLRCEFAL